MRGRERVCSSGFSLEIVGRGGVGEREDTLKRELHAGDVSAYVEPVPNTGFSGTARKSDFLCETKQGNQVLTSEFSRECRSRDGKSTVSGQTPTVSTRFQPKKSS